MKLRFLYAFLAIVFCLSCKTKREKIILGQNNAIWTESIYLRGYNPTTYEKLTLNKIKEYCEKLKRNKIKYSYLFAGPFQKNGQLPSYGFSDSAKETIKKMKEFYPELKILPWIGGIQNKTVYLNDSIWVKKALASTIKLIETLKCDGVHLDFEFIVKDDPYLYSTVDKEKTGDYEFYGKNVNKFHKLLRASLPSCFISSVVTSTSTGIHPWKRKTTLEELKILTKYIDQLNFLFYDTQIGEQYLFEKSCEEQLKHIELLKSLNKNVQYILAIGTFVNDPLLQNYRNLYLENIPNTLKTIKKSIELVSSKEQLVDGISIFCDWETDSNEWDEFYRNWSSNVSFDLKN